MDVTEIYGNWPAIKALVDDGAARAPLLRELYAELQRRHPGFEGFAGDMFREMTGYPSDEKLGGLSLTNSFRGLVPELLDDKKLVQVAHRSNANVYQVSAVDARHPKEQLFVHEVAQAEKPKSWRDSAMDAIRKLTPNQFEHLVEAWATAVFPNGDAKVTKQSADGGFDVEVRFPPLDGKVLIEAKLWSKSKVGSPVVQKLRGALASHLGDKGYVIAPGGFTPAAVAEARATGKPQVTLVGGDELLADMKKHGLGLKVEMVEKVTVDHDWFRIITEQATRAASATNVGDEDANLGRS